MNDSIYELEALRDMQDYPKGTKIIYTGSLRNKPKGWIVVRQIRGRS